MKVLDLQCGQGHTFEGWFGSLPDFEDQCTRQLVQCPFCGNAQITKKLSAPRLNFGATRFEPATPAAETSPSQASLVESATSNTAAWVEMARHVIANTDDVGNQFAQEARRIHYGEAEVRAIRGTSSADEVLALLDEGVPVLPVVLPEAFKRPLH